MIGRLFTPVNSAVPKSGFIGGSDRPSFGGMSSETIEIAPGRTMQLRVYRGSSPVQVLHLHGGAFAGDVECGAAVAAVLAEVGATVFSAEYPVGIAHPF